LAGSQALDKERKLENHYLALFIDGLKLNNAYGSTLSGIPTRTRFSPQLFTGTFFSTGAYSAEYGQALSSVLVLNTIDMPARTQTDLSLMTVGGSASHTQAWDKSALTSSLSYLNLQPYQALVPQNIEWKKAPQGYDGQLLYRYRFNKHSLLKILYTHQHSSFSIVQPQPGNEASQKVDLDNNYNYLNTNLEQAFGNNWLLHTGISFSHNSDEIQLDTLLVKQIEQLAHIKAKLSYFPMNRLSLKLGSEYYYQEYRESLGLLERKVKLPLMANFLEASYHFSSELALNGGLRSEYFNNSHFLMPRLSLAYRLSSAHQFSLAYGDFYQQQANRYLIQKNNLGLSFSRHYLLNYQWKKDLRFLRVEFYQKDYNQLLSFPFREIETNGFGYARGIDLFYRDRKSIESLDFWITYSFIDSKRLFRQFTEEVQPSFAPQHNLSVVGKYWFDKLKSQLGLSYNFNDGYPYDNPNIKGQQESKTKPYSNLSLSWSYLHKPNLIFHIALSNVAGSKNIFGYSYSEQPNNNGLYDELPLGQAADRFFFIGIFYTISSDKKANQLNNL